MRRGLRVRIAAFGTIILAGIFAQASSQEIPRNITKEELAKNNKLFIELAAKVLHWWVTTLLDTGRAYKVFSGWCRIQSRLLCR